MNELALFTSAALTVFALGFQQQNVHGRRYGMAVATSLLIGACQILWRERAGNRRHSLRLASRHHRRHVDASAHRRVARHPPPPQQTKQEPRMIRTALDNLRWLMHYRQRGYPLSTCLRFARNRMRIGSTL